MIADYYHRVYNVLCGLHPNVYPWHFQWLAIKDLRADLRRVLLPLKGRILDVGCGDKPYQDWIGQAEEYIGIDVCVHPKVDIVVDPMKPWPFEPNSFDVILCTQVMEHVAWVEQLLTTIQHVLKPGGTLIISAPFIYNEHGIPEDYRRFSIHGMKHLVSDKFQIVEEKIQGGIGSTVGTLCLNWFEAITSRCKGLRFLKGILFPLWIVFCFTVNSLGWVVDKMDRTQAFYSNFLLVVRKPSM